MITFSFHNPAKLSLLIDRSKYLLVQYYSEEDYDTFVKAARTKTDKEKVIFFNNFQQLITLGARLILEKKTMRLEYFKILVVDAPARCFKFKTEVLDAETTSTGIWRITHYTEKSLNRILSKCNTGPSNKIVRKEFKSAAQQILEDRAKPRRVRNKRDTAKLMAGKKPKRTRATT